MLIDKKIIQKTISVDESSRKVKVIQKKKEKRDDTIARSSFLYCCIIYIFKIIIH